MAPAGPGEAQLLQGPREVLQHDPELRPDVVDRLRRSNRLLQRVGGAERAHQGLALLRNGTVQVCRHFKEVLNIVTFKKKYA